MQISCIPFSAASCIQQLTYLTNHNLQNKIHRHIFVLKMVQLSDQSSAYLCSYRLLKSSPFEIDTIHKSQNSVIDHGSFFIRGSHLLLLLKLFEDFLCVPPIPLLPRFMFLLHIFSSSKIAFPWNFLWSLQSPCAGHNRPARKYCQYYLLLSVEHSVSVIGCFLVNVSIQSSSHGRKMDEKRNMFVSL